MSGWVSLWRKIFENPIVPPAKVFSKFEAWVWLLLNVNHTEGKVVIGNEIVNIPVGSRVTSIKKLCSTFGWGNTKVRNFLKLLAKDGMIEYSSNTQYTFVSVCNYETYQNKQTTRKSPATCRRTSTESQANTNNNKAITKKNEYKDARFLEFWKSYPKRVGKKDAYKSWVKLGENEIKSIFANLPQQCRLWSRTHTELKYIPNPSTWLNQGRWDDDLSGTTLREVNEKRNELSRKRKELDVALELDRDFKEGNEKTPDSILRTIRTLTKELENDSI